MGTEIKKRDEANVGQICDGNSFALAVAVIRERIDRLEEEDRQDLYELLPFLFLDDEDERQAAQVAVNEILDQKCFSVGAMDLPKSPSENIEKWLEFISGRIKEARKSVGLTQAELSAKAGIPQSHISRLERGEHSPTTKTVRKIAVALGIAPKDLDPMVADDD